MASGSESTAMDMESKFGPMELVMRVSFKTTKLTGEESFGISMEIYLMDTGSMIRLMVRVYTNTPMEPSMMVIGRMICRMAMELKFGNTLVIYFY